MKKSVIVIIVIGIIILISAGLYMLGRRYEYETDYGYLDNISFNIDDEFKEGSIRGYYHYYSNSVSCDFEVDSFYPSGYVDGGDYLKNRVYFTLNDKVSEIEEVSLNGYTWYYLKIENKRGISYRYATIWGGVGYEIDYSIRDYLNGDYAGDKDNYCYIEYDRVISSIRFN